MPQPRQASRLRPRTVLVGLAVLGFVTAFRPVADMDYHWHLAQGRALLAGELPAPDDPFTHLPLAGRPTLQAWGADALFALLDRLGGTTLVRLLLATVVGLSWALAFELARRRCREVGAAFLVAAFFAAASLLRLRARPEVFSLALPWALLLVFEGRPGLGRAALAFGLEAAWINLHPGGLLGPLLAVARLPGPDWRRRLAPALAVLLGSCVHPEGPAMLGLFAGETADLAPLIPEWRPLWQLDAGAFVAQWILVAIAAAVLVAAAPALRDRAPDRWLLAGLGLAFAARAVRFLHLLTLPVLAAVEALVARPRATRLRRRAFVALGVALLCGGPGLDLWRVHRATHAAGLSPFADLHAPHYPVAAADWLERSDLEGRLFHPAAWGGYLAARLHPRYRTAHDGRVNLYGPELAARLLRFHEGSVRDRLVEELQLEILVLPPGLLPRETWADPARPADPVRRWLPVWADPAGHAVIFVDLRGPHAAANLRALRRRG